MSRSTLGDFPSRDGDGVDCPYGPDLRSRPNLGSEFHLSAPFFTSFCSIGVTVSTVRGSSFPRSLGPRSPSDSVLRTLRPHPPCPRPPSLRHGFPVELCPERPRKFIVATAQSFRTPSDAGVDERPERSLLSHSRAGEREGEWGWDLPLCLQDLGSERHSRWTEGPRHDRPSCFSTPQSGVPVPLRKGRRPSRGIGPLPVLWSPSLGV